MKKYILFMLCLLPLAGLAVQPNQQTNQQQINRIHNEVFGSSNGITANTQVPNDRGIVNQGAFEKQRNFAQKLSKQIERGQSVNTAVNSLKHSANTGNKWAALEYGYLAAMGRLPSLGGKPNYALAAKAYRLASKTVSKDGIRNINGNYLAAYNLGLMYYYGQGTKANGREALKWFRASLDAYPKSQRTFWPSALYAARILEHGYGVPVNNKEAIKYWEAAAKEKESTAMYGYAMMILSGKGTVPNPYKAYPLLIQAANRWNINAMIALAHYQSRQEKYRKNNPVDAAKWLLIAATIDKKKFGKKADAAMSVLSEAHRKQAANAMAIWLSTHNIMPEDFDYKAHLNNDPPVRR